MRLLTVEQMRSVETLAQSQFGFSDAELMEAAGQAVASEVQTFMKEKKRKILFLVGPGNNGADGFVAARILKRQGYVSVRCQTVEAKKNPSEIWSLQKEKAQNSGIEICTYSTERLQLEINESDLIVDAVYGIGFRGPLSSETSTLFNFINGKKTPVLSIDLPSGLDPQTGLEVPVALKAHVTVTFGLAKPGFFVQRGPRNVGALKVHGIGFPTTLLRSESSTHFAWGENATRSVLPRWDDTSYKSDHGTIYVFAGSQDFPGAGLLVANAAGRAGAGYVYLVSDDVYKLIPLAPEIIFRSRAKFSLKDLDKDATYVLGPGLGTGEDTGKLIRELKKRRFEKVILDADALTVCALEKIFPVPASWIITPHAGELARVLEISTKSVSKNRYEMAHAGAVKAGCVALYKGFRTVVSDGQRDVVILSGNAALGKAGAGDVLSGFIAALRAQGLGPVAAAASGAYIHGRLADEWLKNGRDVMSLLPSDLSETVPQLLQQIRKR